MKVKAIEKGKDKAILHVSETTPHYMNTIRRILMTEVPVMAVEEVEFRKNNSILYDEMVAHRLGLLPLTTDLKSYNLKDECKCKGKGCASCELKLTLKAKAGDKETMVYAKEIKSKDPKVKPVYGDMPIAKLLPGQEIECEMVAVLGKGGEHSKWSPGLAWFKYYPHVKINKQPSDAKKLAEEFPFAFEMKGGKLAVKEKELLRHDVIDESIENRTNGAVTYEEKDDFVFFIESWGQLDTKAMFEQAINVHNDHLKEFKKLMKEVK